MGYFWLGLIVILAAYVSLVVFICKKRKDPVLIGVGEFLISKKVYFISALVFILLMYVWLLKAPLWNTVGCQYDGHVRDVETKYDWVKKICYFKTKSGTWMPLNMGRDSGEDKNHDVQLDDQQDVQ
jgi:hypothetical protein